MTSNIAIAEALRASGRSASGCASLIASVQDDRATLKPILQLKDELKRTGVQCEGDLFERALLSHAIEASESRLDSFPVPDSVREMLRKQYRLFEQPQTSGLSLAVDADTTDPFIAACKMCTLRRFPAGPLDWVVSGMPRSWFMQMPFLELPGAAKYIFGDFGGLKPVFYVHIAHPPRNRSLVIPKEVRRAYFRMAQALMLQPEVKGVMCATWLHDPAAIDMYPYIASLNEPYVEFGGKLVTNLGPAPESSGFLKFNSNRREQYERGDLKLKSVVAMWPRKAAIDWAEKNSAFST